MTKIISVVLLFIAFSLNVQAADNFKALEKWKPENPAEVFEATFLNSVVAQTANYLLVREDAGTACPGGNYWLFNKKAKSYRSVDPGTCIEEPKIILNKNSLTFFEGKTITAKYPLYSF